VVPVLLSVAIQVYPRTDHVYHHIWLQDLKQVGYWTLREVCFSRDHRASSCQTLVDECRSLIVLSIYQLQIRMSCPERYEVEVEVEIGASDQIENCEKSRYG